MATHQGCQEAQASARPIGTTSSTYKRIRSLIHFSFVLIADTGKRLRESRARLDNLQLSAMQPNRASDSESSSANNNPEVSCLALPNIQLTHLATASLKVTPSHSYAEAMSEIGARSCTRVLSVVTTRTQGSYQSICTHSFHRQQLPNWSYNPTFLQHSSSMVRCSVSPAAQTWPGNLYRLHLRRPYLCGQRTLSLLRYIINGSIDFRFRNSETR